MARKTAIFVNGGAGRSISSIPAIEKYIEDNADLDPIIICEGGTDAYKGHPKLHYRAYDNWHKNLFQDLLKDRDLLSPEPYRVWEYYNQKCSLGQAYDIAINDKGIRDLPRANLKLSKEEMLLARKMITEVKEKTGKDKIVVFQPFGRGAQPEKLEEKHKEMMIEQDKALISAKWEVSKENKSYLSQMNKDISAKIKELADIVKNRPII